MEGCKTDRTGPTGRTYARRSTCSPRVKHGCWCALKQARWRRAAPYMVHCSASSVTTTLRCDVHRGEMPCGATGCPVTDALCWDPIQRAWASTTNQFGIHPSLIHPHHQFEVPLGYGSAFPVCQGVPETSVPWVPDCTLPGDPASAAPICPARTQPHSVRSSGTTRAPPSRCRRSSPACCARPCNSPNQGPLG